MPAILRTGFGLADATDTKMNLTEAAAGDGTGDESADGQDRQEEGASAELRGTAG